MFNKKVLLQCKEVYFRLCLCPNSTVVEHLTHNLKIKGLNPSSCTGRENRQVYLKQKREREAVVELRQ